ncbi:MAG: transglutaminase domain-containing protein [Bacilli bacterium]|nr:transglutaminase domain-containing protein [Bacilli bacterium]
MIKRLIVLILIFMGLYYIYDHDFYGSQQFVRDIRRDVYLPSSNVYRKSNITNDFVKMTSDFVPDNKQELLDIYYTVVNSGWDNFTFYCNYDECIEDVNRMSTDIILLSNLNSFVSPYNQYDTISTYTTPLFNSKVRIVVTRAYDDYTINQINKKVNELYDSLNLKDHDAREQIKIVHDYIIKNSKYDTLKIDDIYDDTYRSSIAYGPLIEGYAVCSGYADAMAIFLDKIGVPNHKVASRTHVWNLVYLDNKWHHLDLTWDDPYSPDGRDLMNHYFFLIDYQTLKEWNTGEHGFDHKIYKNAL